MILKEKKCSSSVRVALSLLASSALTMSSAYAEDGTNTEKVQKIVITGSNIKHVDAEGPAAVVVVKRVDIERTGAGTVVELLATLTGTTSSFDGTTSNSFSQGAAAVSLRGLGEKNVLVLLNGRRLANYGYAQNTDSSFFDLNSLPLSALERVEILRDGASAIYGSDAVAGVINFITRKNYQGAEGSIRLGMNQAGDSKETSIGVSAGFGDMDADKQNLLLSLDLYRSEPYVDGKHALTRSDDLRPYGGRDGRSTNIYPGSFYRLDEAAYREAMPGCKGVVAVDSSGDQYCRFDNAPLREGTLQRNRSAIAAVFTRQLNDQLEFFVEAGFSNNITKYKTGFPTIGAYNHYIYPGDAAYKETLNGIENSGRLIAFRSVYEAGSTTSEVNSDSIRTLAGLRGTYNSWDIESALSYSKNKVTTSDRGLLADAIDNAYQNGGYDPFKLQNSDADVKALLTNFYRKAESKLLSWDAKASTEKILSLPAGNVGFATGVSIVREQARDTPDALITANKVEDNGGTETNGQRTVKSVYGEFNIPVLKTLEVQLALRHDHYSDFGGTTNPKIAYAFRPVENLLFRGSATTSFKAPTLPQLYMSPTKAYSSGVKDHVRCGPLGYTDDQCAYYPELKLVSNPGLQPEKSKNLSFGIVFEPIKNYSISIDYYNISQKDTITTIDEQYILDHEFTDPAMKALIERDPRNPALEAAHPGLKDGRLRRLTLPFLNVGKTETDGIDFTAKGEFIIGGFGKISLQNDFNTILKLKQSFIAGEALVERAGGRWNPKWRNNFTIALTKDAWRGQIVTHTSAGFVDAGEVWRAGSTTATLPSYTTADFNLSYSGFKNTNLNFGINNLLDRMPRFSIDNGSFYDSTAGRFIYGSIRYAFK